MRESANVVVTAAENLPDGTPGQLIFHKTIGEWLTWRDDTWVTATRYTTNKAVTAGATVLLPRLPGTAVIDEVVGEDLEIEIQAGGFSVHNTGGALADALIAYRLTYS